MNMTFSKFTAWDPYTIAKYKELKPKFMSIRTEAATRGVP